MRPERAVIGTVAPHAIPGLLSGLPATKSGPIVHVVAPDDQSFLQVDEILLSSSRWSLPRYSKSLAENAEDELLSDREDGNSWSIFPGSAVPADQHPVLRVDGHVSSRPSERSRPAALHAAGGAFQAPMAPPRCGSRRCGTVHREPRQYLRLGLTARDRQVVEVIDGFAIGDFPVTTSACH
jgi:hypothetical protein